jgi:hypothetical protein
MFTNPVQPKQIGSVSVDQPVVDTSAQTALAGVSDMLKVFGTMQKNSAPDAWQVKEQWETEGHSAAVEDAKQYQFLVETSGRQKADQWLNKQTLVRQGGLGASSADSYRDVLNANIGKTKEIVDRENEQSLEKRSMEKLQDLELQGQELLAADVARYGGDVSTISKDTMIGMALAYNGTQARTAARTQEVALTQSELNLSNDQRKLKSEAGINTFLGNTVSSVQSKLVAATEAMKANPAKAEQIKLQFIADLSQQKTTAVTAAQKSILSLGGDPSDVSADRITGIQKMYDDTIALVRGDFATDVMTANLKQLSYGTTLEVLGAMPKGFATQLLMENTTRMPIQALGAVVKAGDPSYSLNDTNEVVRRSVGGIATAVQGTNVSHVPFYKLTASTVVKASTSTDDTLRGTSAEALLNTLSEPYQGPRKIRELSSRPDAVPALFEQLARSTQKGELLPELNAAAQAEGTTPLDVWIQSSTGVLRNTIAPSLLLEDPNVIGNLDLKYAGGKFTLRLNEPAYRKASNLSANPGYYSGIDQSMTKINRLNSNLRLTEKFLNDAAQSYSRTTGSSADDVGVALYEMMNLTFNLSKPE